MRFFVGSELRHTHNPKRKLTLCAVAAKTLLRWEVVRNGRTIVAAEPERLLEFQARVPIERADLEPYYQRESDGLRRALEKTRWSGSSSSATKSVA